jgi:hypothetical protein
MNMQSVLLSVGYVVAALMLLVGCQPAPNQDVTPAAPNPSRTPAPTATKAVPTAQPSPVAPVGLADVQASVTQSLIAGDSERMRGLMSDPFTFAYWQSEGPLTTRDEALVLIKEALAQRGDLVFEPYDVIQKLHWREYAEDGSRLVRALRVRGWRSSVPEAEALVLLYQRPDGRVVWTALVISNVGLP